MIVDAHAHLGPALASQSSLYPGASGQQLVALMDRARIDKACVFAPLWTGGDFFDPEFKDANRAIYEATRAFPDRLIGYGRVHPKYGLAAMDELQRCIHDYRFSGLKLHPDCEGYRANDLELLAPIFEQLTLCRMVVFSHSGYFPTCQPALFAPLARAFPGVSMILAHVGYRHWVDAAVVAQLEPNIYIETSGNATPTTIMGAIRLAGADRMLFGTDSPYHEPLYTRAKIEMLPELTEVEKRLVMGGNMLRLLGLGE